MNSRLKWVCLLSLLTLLVWACDREEPATAEPESAKPQASAEKAPSAKTPEMQQTGDRSETAGTDEKMDATADAADLDQGEEVYQQSCASCHDQGIAGAPKLTDVEDWKQRLQKGMDTLNDHAINGYQGETGMMPAKGGNPALSDQEVEAAVAYMVAEATE